MTRKYRQPILTVAVIVLSIYAESSIDKPPEDYLDTSELNKDLIEVITYDLIV